MAAIYDFTALDISGRETSLADYRGQGAADRQHRQQVRVHPAIRGAGGAAPRVLAPRGFAVLGFPCNQFGAQEPGDAAEIADFC